MNRHLLRTVLEMDESIIVGGCPHLDVEPVVASDYALDLAMELGRQLDLHTDETLDGSHLELRHLVQRVRETGFDRDEDTARLGQALKLPVQHELLRSRLEQSLQQLDGKLARTRYARRDLHGLQPAHDR